MRMLKIIFFSMMALTATTGFAAGNDHAAIRKQAKQHYQDGNFKNAIVLFKRLCLEVKNDPQRVGSDLNQAWKSMQQLNRVDELDKFREQVITRHSKNWRLLAVAAQTYTGNTHWGFMIGGEFKRGNHRGGGKAMNAIARDRTRALQLMHQAMGLAEDDPATKDVARFYLNLGNMINQFRGQTQSWRLHALTDLSTLPDYEPGYGYEYDRQTAGASVDENGRPLFHQLPQSWEAAATDGERWRWTHQRALELAPDFKARVDYAYANFLHMQFGVQTLAQYGRLLERSRPVDEGQAQDPNAAAYAVHTLGDNETIAKLATGIKRLKLPADHNHIKIFKELAQQQHHQYADDAISKLAQIYENRKQYKRAIRYWEDFKPYNKQHARQRISQIRGNWGRFESIGTQPALQRPTVEYRYRNGDKVSFRAHRIKVPRLLKDIKSHIRSNPQRLDWNRINLSNIGWRLVQDNQTRYLGREAARWSLELKPDERHWDSRVTVQMPDALKQAGAYLVVAEMENGNTARIIIWVNDTAIVRKPVQNQVLYYVADAVTGKPLANTRVECFGYRRQNISGTKRYVTRHLSFTRRTDINGLIYINSKEMASNRQWLVTAGDGKQRLAFLGFSRVWHGRRHDNVYDQTKTLVMTDRPVYRPKQTVQFKMWVRKAKYDLEASSVFAGRRFEVQIHNPKNEKIYTKNLTTDEYGGLAGEFALPTDAALGVYRISHNSGGQFGGQTFRVEEYKKPEFEVKIEAPKTPVMLGEQVTAVIKADYYFGSPVTQATVNYKVLRRAHDSRWYPKQYWDWFYGPGYWWYGYDYPWYPGWETWGCPMPIRSWWPHLRELQPEVVADGQARIGEDGTLSITIDTALAKLIHGDSDHRYTIQAEVRDQSRRTIAATGEVLVARRPFKVYAWVDRGHYRVGDTVKANFKAQTLDQTPVAGTGSLKLMRVSNKEGQPTEREVRSWTLNPNERGEAKIQIQASQPGQYRLAYTVTDTKGHNIEGGYIFNVRGRGNDGSDFRFAKIELIPDKTQYTAGEVVRLLINTDRPGVTVLLFVRPSNGVYLPPRIIKLSGKSTTQEIVVAKKDMPNFYIEALTIYGGKVHSDVREIVVPPEKRLLDVEVKPSKETFRPGENAKLQLALRDRFGKPFAGEAVITVYDRSVEYISGGSNVPDIRSFFWKWRRHHTPQIQSSLRRWFSNQVKQDETPMATIGVFGELVAETETDSNKVGLGLAEKSADEARDGLRSRLAKPSSASAPAPNNASKKMALMEMADVETKQPAEAPEATKPAVRTQFADTAFWAANVHTDSKGMAEVAFDMPENLTSWKAVVWAMGHGTTVGQQVVEMVTRKDLILRLQAPRFFVETDEVVLSANVHNYLDTAKKIKVKLELEGGCLERMPRHTATQTVTIDTNGEARVNWRVKVRKEGEAVIRMLAISNEESDAVQMRFPVVVHGMMKQVPKSGVIRPGQTGASLSFDVPAERRVAQSRLELRYSPTLAGAMVDALPYLASYPYGCTEQTLNRFLPTVITQNTLQRMGLNLADIKAKRSNLNAQEIGDDRGRSAQWRRYKHNPVFDDAQVAEMVAAGIKRLGAMQLSDGGWGWFSGYGEHAYPHTTAVVVHGLQMARSNGAAVPDRMIERGVAWLKNYQARELARLKLWKKTKIKGKPRTDNLDALVYMVLVDEDMDQKAMREYLYRHRNHLAVYAKAMFGLALNKVKDNDKLGMIIQNIEQYLVEDNENQTAWLKLPSNGYWWHWYGSEYEAHGYYLKLLARTAPNSPKASRLVKYLLNNRKHATYWNSTRDTAVIVEAFAEYISASGETGPDMTIDIRYDGRLLKTVKIDKTNLFTFDNKLVLTGSDITSGKHTLEITKSGKGPLYFNAYLDYFTLEDFITREGLEIKVQRKVFKMEKADKAVKAAGSRGQVVDKKVEKYNRHPLKNMDTLKSGDLVEVELIIESKNDYEYLVFEDMKAAGFEAVKVRSGYTGNEMGAYVEFRDQKVCFFVRQLARGRHSVSYRLRAEIPGKFSALPTRAYAMYAPELKANSDEIKLTIVD